MKVFNSYSASKSEGALKHRSASGKWWHFLKKASWFWMEGALWGETLLISCKRMSPGKNNFLFTYIFIDLLPLHTKVEQQGNKRYVHCIGYVSASTIKFLVSREFVCTYSLPNTCTMYMYNTLRTWMYQRLKFSKRQFCFCYTLLQPLCLICLEAEICCLFVLTPVKSLDHTWH